MVSMKHTGSSFENIMRRFMAIYLAMIRNPQDGEELAQDVFVLAYLRLDQLREPGTFFPWLKKITRNRSKNRVRRAGPRAVSMDLASAYTHLLRNSSYLASGDSPFRVSSRRRGVK